LFEKLVLLEREWGFEVSSGGRSVGGALDDLAADDDSGEDEERVADEGDQVAGEMARDGEHVR